MSAGGWLRLQQDFYDDPRIVQAVLEQGPLAAAAAIFALAESKKQNKAGNALLSALVLARNANVTVDQANAAITSLVTNGFVLLTGDSDVFFVVDFPKLQPDSRPRSDKRGDPDESQGVPGTVGASLGDVTGRHVTARDEKKKNKRARPPRLAAVAAEPPSAEERKLNAVFSRVVLDAHRTDRLGAVNAALAANGGDIEAAVAALETA